MLSGPESFEISKSSRTKLILIFNFKPCIIKIKDVIETAETVFIVLDL